MRHMSPPPVTALVVGLALAGVLLVSGVAKARDRRATADAFTALRVPEIGRTEVAASLLPWGEIALALLLLLAPAPWLVPASAVALVLMLAYTVLVARALGFDPPVTCSCFGSIGRHTVDRTTLVRNVLLTLLAAFVLWFALDGGSLISAVGDLGAKDWALLAAVAAVVAVVGLVVGPGPLREPEGSLEPLDYARQAIPFGSLVRADGTTVTLVELSRSQATLVVVLNPGCAPCVRTAQKLDAWAHQLAPAVGVVAVYPDATTARTATEHATDLAAWEPELNVRRVFSVGTPGAALLGADGLMAGGPVAGEHHIDDFVQEIRDQLGVESTPTE